MVYDISTTSVTDLARNENLVQMLIDNNKVERVKGIDSIKTAIQYLEEIYTTAKSFEKRIKQRENKAQVKTVINHETVISHDHAPCQDCGSISFFRTGTCFVCQNCASSQGCS